MNTWWSFISLLLTTAAGVRFSRRRSTLRLYFWAQLLNAPVVFMGAHYLGSHATVYALLYTAVTLPVLECCCFMAWDAGLRTLHTRIAIAFGLFVGMVATFDMPPHPLVDYVTFAEGVLLVMVGTAMMLGQNTSSHSMLIGALSFALSTYDFGWLHNDDWSMLNDWLPSAMCTVVFATIVLTVLRRTYGRSSLR